MAVSHSLTTRSVARLGVSARATLLHTDRLLMPCTAGLKAMALLLCALSLGTLAFYPPLKLLKWRAVGIRWEAKMVPWRGHLRVLEGHAHGHGRRGEVRGRCRGAVGLLPSRSSATPPTPVPLSPCRLCYSHRRTYRSRHCTRLL